MTALPVKTTLLAVKAIDRPLTRHEAKTEGTQTLEATAMVLRSRIRPSGFMMPSALEFASPDSAVKS